MTMTLPGQPNTDYTFGQDFNYALWEPGTIVDLVNVPWNNDYRDVVRFANRAGLDNYINSLSPTGIKVEDLSYLKPNQPIRLNVPHNRALRYNYLRASNPLQPIDGDIVHNYYYFILDTKYVAPHTTELTLQLDVWQTFIYDVTLGNCYVERGHIGIANENAFNNYGRDYLTIPEGFDVGSDMYILGSSTEVVMRAASGDPDSDCAILVCSTIDLTADPGDVNNPYLITAKGGTFGGLPSGASFYMFRTAASFQNWLAQMQTKPWVTQGIIHAMVVPPTVRYFIGFSYQPDGKPTPMSAQAPNALVQNMVSNFRDLFLNAIPSRYRHLLKFLTSGYSAIELTTLTGNPIVLKPELWHRDDAIVVESPTLLPPGHKISIFPQGYNVYGADIGESYDHATHLGSFPEMAIVNNGAISYLAGNKNSIAYQRSAADWAQQRALAGAGASAAISSGEISTASDVTNIANQAAGLQVGNTNRTIGTQAIVNSLASPVGGAGAGAAVGGGAGAMAGTINGLAGGIAGNLNTLVQQAANVEAYGISSGQATAATNRQNEQRGFVRDTNLGLAQFAAKGDYANAIAGINAKVQDAQMIQPSVSGQLGGESLNFIHGLYGYQLRFKMIDQSSIRSVGEYWLRYGYSIRTFMKLPPLYKAMSKFTYWKLSETYITSSSVPEGFKQVIRGMFEKGITVWSTPSDIGQIDLADNKPIVGIKY